MPDAPPTHLEIKDWSEHQHYRDRRPPWIKLHRSLLTNAAFLEMSEAAQAQLMKLWLLASQMGHPLPNKPAVLARAIGVHGKFRLPELLASGFLVPTTPAPMEQDASTALASCDGTKREGENREQRTETTSSPPAWQPIAEQRLAERLPTEAGRRALTVILAAPEASKAGIVSMLTAVLEGMHGTASPEAMESALIEYAAGGLTNGRWNSRHFGGFLRTAKQPPRPETATGGDALDHYLASQKAKEALSA